MPNKPFINLLRPRSVEQYLLPSQLAAFYAQHEGVGKSSKNIYSIKLYKLNEVRLIGWSDLGFVSEVPFGWNEFKGLLIAQGDSFEKIISVIDAPSCASNSVIAIGTGIVGPGGSGPLKLESTIVLALDFLRWIDHLEQWNWQEPILGHNMSIAVDEQQILLKYYQSLNPDILL